MNHNSPCSGQLLLTAAIGEGEQALSAFQAWKEVRPHQLDSHLLPLVYHNLRKQGFPEQARPLAKHYCHNLVRNAALRTASIELLQQLESFGFKVMVLKGVVWAEDYYRNWSLRWSRDIDLLAPPGKFDFVLQALREAGYSVGGEHFHARHLYDGKGFCLDLHRFALHECQSEELNDAIWSCKEPFQLGEAAAYKPAATDMFFHQLIHGTREPLSLRWLVDLKMLLEEKSIDWDRMVELARISRLPLSVLNGLQLLESSDLVQLPSTLPARLDEIRLGYVDTLYQKWREGECNPRTWEWLDRYRAIRLKRASLSAELCRRWELESKWQLPAEVPRRLARLLVPMRDVGPD